MIQARQESMKFGLIAMGVALMTVVLFAFLYVRMVAFDFDEKKAVMSKQIAALQEQADLLRSSMDEKSSQLAAVEEEKREIESQIQALRDDNDALRAELTDKLAVLEKKRKALKMRIKSLESGSALVLLRDAAAQSDNETIRQVLNDALKRVELIEQGKPVDLAPIVVGQEDKGGSIVSVDKRSNLIVFNLGRKNGIEEGDRVQILDCSTDIASAEVISTRYMIAAGFVDSYSFGKNMKSIKEGMKVVVAKK